MSNVNNKNQMRVKKFATLAAFNAQKKNLEYPGIFMIADGTNIDGVAKNISAKDSFAERITPMTNFAQLAAGKAVWTNGTNFVLGDIQNSDAKDKAEFIGAGYQLIGWSFYVDDFSKNDYETVFEQERDGEDHYAVQSNGENSYRYLYVVGVNAVQGIWYGNLENNFLQTEYKSLICETHSSLTETKTIQELSGDVSQYIPLNTFEIYFPELMPSELHSDNDKAYVYVAGLTKRFVYDGKDLTDRIQKLLENDSDTYPEPNVYNSVKNYYTLGTSPGDWFIPSGLLTDKILDRISADGHVSGNDINLPLVKLYSQTDVYGESHNMLVAQGYVSDYGENEGVGGLVPTTNGANMSQSGRNRYGYTLSSQSKPQDYEAQSVATYGYNSILPVLRFVGDYNSYTFHIG